MDWKHAGVIPASRTNVPPHSLGKLMDWKPLVAKISFSTDFSSPLAGETNGLET